MNVWLPLICVLAIFTPQAIAQTADVECSKGDLEGLQTFRIPPDSYLRDSSVELTLTLLVAPDGTYEDIRITESSRMRDIDRAALELIGKTRLTGSCLQASTGLLHVHYKISLTPNGVDPDGIVRVWRTKSQ